MPQLNSCGDCVSGRKEHGEQSQEDLHRWSAGKHHRVSVEGTFCSIWHSQFFRCVCFECLIYCLKTTNILCQGCEDAADWDGGNKCHNYITTFATNSLVVHVNLKKKRKTVHTHTYMYEVRQTLG